MHHLAKFNASIAFGESELPVDHDRRALDRVSFVPLARHKVSNHFVGRLTICLF
jgi:hypothetical protein